MDTKKNESTAEALDNLLRSLDALEQGLQGALKEIQSIRDVCGEPERKPE